jgi:hypothetical protein
VDEGVFRMERRMVNGSRGCCECEGGVMSVTWGISDVEHFRKLGIDISEAKEPGYGPVVKLALWTAGGVVSGMLWYGILLAAAWALRALGVVITGI